MPIERLLNNRFALPQTSIAWEQKFARVSAWLASVPLNRWQFLIRLLLVISLSVSLARLFWLLLPNPSIPPSAVIAAAPVAQVASGGSDINIAQIKSLPIFGKVEAPSAQAPVAQPENQAVDSRLNILLMGLIYSPDEALARAILTSGDTTDIYAIGNPIQAAGSGVTLAKIMEDRVIINNNGQFESVWLYQNNPNAAPISQSFSAPVRNDPPPAYNNPPQSYQPPQQSLPPPNGAAGRDAEHAVAEASRNLADVVAMSIYREGGKVIGYKIRPGRDAEKFRALGLQADDIVTSVNGMPLTNPAKIMEIYKNMGNTTSANLEILRSGNVITVDVVLQ